MAKAEHVKKLIGSYGRPKDFRAAALKIIEEADTKGHKPLAVSLRKVLEANVREEPAPRREASHILAKSPIPRWNLSMPLILNAA
jgi:hypothetical protein